MTKKKIGKQKITALALVAAMLGSSTASATNQSQGISADMNPATSTTAINTNNKTEMYALAASKFTDVNPNSYYFSAIDFVTELGLFTGTSATTFSPEGTMTRAMFVTVLGKLYEKNGYEISVYGNSRFNDVVMDSWYGKYVVWATELGFVSGYGNGKFGPNDNVTREQAAVFLYRFAEIMNVKLEKNDDYINDPNSISDWSKEAVIAIVNGRVMFTLADCNFKPKENATREQLADALSNYVNKYNKEIINNANNTLDAIAFYRNAEERAALQSWIDDVMNLKVTSLTDAQKEDFIGYWIGYSVDKNPDILVTSVEISDSISTMDYTSNGRIRISKKRYDALNNITKLAISNIVRGSYHEIMHGTESIIVNNEFGIEAALLKKYPIFSSLFNKVYSYSYYHGSFWEVRAIYYGNIELLNIYKNMYSETYSYDIPSIEENIIDSQKELYTPTYAISDNSQGTIFPVRSDYQVTKEEYIKTIKEIYSYLEKTKTEAEMQQLYDLIYYSAYYLDYKDAPHYDEMMIKVNSSLEKASTEVNLTGIGSVLPNGATQSDVKDILNYCGINITASLMVSNTSLDSNVLDLKFDILCRNIR